MIFKKISMEWAQFSVETMVDMQELLKYSLKQSSGPCGDVGHDALNDNV